MLDPPSFFGLVREGELFLGRLDSRDVLEQALVLLDEVVFKSPSWVPITEPINTCPDTDVPVGDEPERLFPEEPGLKRGGGGGGPLSEHLPFDVVNGKGSGQVPVPLDELEEVFRIFFRIRPDLRLFDE